MPHCKGNCWHTTILLRQKNFGEGKKRLLLGFSWKVPGGFTVWTWSAGLGRVLPWGAIVSLLIYLAPKWNCTLALSPGFLPGASRVTYFCWPTTTVLYLNYRTNLTFLRMLQSVSNPTEHVQNRSPKSSRSAAKTRAPWQRPSVAFHDIQFMPEENTWEERK